MIHSMSRWNELVQHMPMNGIRQRSTRRLPR
jgi:hypothetical protein